jgi:protein-S-isoprenylcysteine O-methyltransferase Ste14
LACIHNIEYIISRIPILEYDINNTGEWINVLLSRNLGAMLHMMVLAEEEHMRDRFGGEYERYCARMPR